MSNFRGLRGPFVKVVIFGAWRGTLPETNSKSPLKMMVSNRNLLFRGLFSGDMLASRRVTSLWIDRNPINPLTIHWLSALKRSEGEFPARAETPRLLSSFCHLEFLFHGIKVRLVCWVCLGTRWIIMNYSLFRINTVNNLLEISCFKKQIGWWWLILKTFDRL